MGGRLRTDTATGAGEERSKDRTRCVVSSPGSCLSEIPASRPNSNVRRAGQSNPGAPLGPPPLQLAIPTDPALWRLGHEAQVSQRLRYTQSLAPGDTPPSRMLSPPKPRLVPRGQRSVCSLPPPPLPLWVPPDEPESFQELPGRQLELGWRKFPEPSCCPGTSRISLGQGRGQTLWAARART